MGWMGESVDDSALVCAAVGEIWNDPGVFGRGGCGSSRHETVSRGY